MKISHFRRRILRNRNATRIQGNSEFHTIEADKCIAQSNRRLLILASLLALIISSLFFYSLARGDDFNVASEEQASVISQQLVALRDTRRAVAESIDTLLLRLKASENSKSTIKKILISTRPDTWEEFITVALQQSGDTTPLYLAFTSKSNANLHFSRYSLRQHDDKEPISEVLIVCESVSRQAFQKTNRAAINIPMLPQDSIVISRDFDKFLDTKNASIVATESSAKNKENLLRERASQLTEAEMTMPRLSVYRKALECTERIATQIEIAIKEQRADIEAIDELNSSYLVQLRSSPYTLVGSIIKRLGFLFITLTAGFVIIRVISREVSMQEKFNSLLFRVKLASDLNFDKVTLENIINHDLNKSPAKPSLDHSEFSESISKILRSLPKQAR